MFCLENGSRQTCSSFVSLMLQLYNAVYVDCIVHAYIKENNWLRCYNCAEYYASLIFNHVLIVLSILRLSNC